LAVQQYLETKNTNASLKVTHPSYFIHFIQFPKVWSDVGGLG